MQVSIPIIKYDDDESRALELIEYLSESENVNIMECILKEIIDNIVYNQNKDIIGIINDYEYIKLLKKLFRIDELEMIKRQNNVKKNIKKILKGVRLWRKYMLIK